MSKEIEIIFEDNGTISIDQIGYKGHNCSGDVKDILNALGTAKKIIKKEEYYAKNDVNIRQKF